MVSVVSRTGQERYEEVKKYGGGGGRRDGGRGLLVLLGGAVRGDRVKDEDFIMECKGIGWIREEEGSQEVDRGEEFVHYVYPKF